MKLYRKPRITKPTPAIEVNPVYPRYELPFNPYGAQATPDVINTSPLNPRQEYAREIYEKILHNQPMPEHLLKKEEISALPTPKADEASYETAEAWVTSNNTASIQKLMAALSIKKTTAMKYLDRMQSERIISVAAQGKSREVLKQSTGPDKKDVDALKNDSKAEVIDMGGLL